MRILIVHNQLWAHYKSKLFSEINEIIKNEYPNATFKVLQIALYESSRAGMTDHEPIHYHYPYEVLFSSSWEEIGFFERFLALLRHFHACKPTVLNITGYFDWAQILLMMYARLRGVRVVLSTESSAADHRRQGAKEWVKARIINMADAYFCFGSSTVEYLLSLGVDEGSIAVKRAAVVDEEVILHTFLDAQLRLNQQKEVPPQNFIFVGRLAPEKNLRALLGAYGNLQKTTPEAASWGLLLVGDGPEKDDLHRFVQDNEIHQVTFTGGYPWHQVPKWLAKSKVLVLPSTSEPWGLVVNEAMVCGLPVIVSDRCGCAADLVAEGRNGHVFDPHNQQELEQAMLFYMKNQDKIELMGDYSRRIIAGFSSQLVAREMVDTYFNLSSPKI
jgi:glycosyltransferase involved in cell wall biosynthesis